MSAILDICHYSDFYRPTGLLPFGTFTIIHNFISLGDFCHLWHLPLLKSILIQEAFAILDICHYSDLYYSRGLLPFGTFAIIHIFIYPG